MERNRQNEEFKKMTIEEKLSFLSQFQFTQQLIKIRQVLLGLSPGQNNELTIESLL